MQPPILGSAAHRNRRREHLDGPRLQPWLLPRRLRAIQLGESRSCSCAHSVATLNPCRWRYCGLVNRKFLKMSGERSQNHGECFRIQTHATVDVVHHFVASFGKCQSEGLLHGRNAVPAFHMRLQASSLRQNGTVCHQTENTSFRINVPAFQATPENIVLCVETEVLAHSVEWRLSIIR